MLNLQGQIIHVTQIKNIIEFKLLINHLTPLLSQNISQIREDLVHVDNIMAYSALYAS